MLARSARFRPISAAAACLVLAISAQAASLNSGTDDIIAVGDEISELAGGAMRRINVDGHLVDINVSVRNVGIITSPGARGQRPTSVRVELSSADNQDLPEITAIRVKLERVKPPVRIYRSRLYPELTFAADPRHAGYAADITSFQPGVRLKATVTVTTPHETRIINVGRLRVAPTFVLIDQPSLTD